MRAVSIVCGFAAIAALFAGSITAASADNDVTNFQNINPNGDWSYWSGATGTQMYLMNAFSYLPLASLEHGIMSWGAESPHGSATVGTVITPHAAAFMDPTNPDILHVPDDLLLIPDVDLNGAAIVCWTSSRGVDARFSGWFEVLDTKAHGVGTYVFLNNTDVTQDVFPVTKGNLQPTTPVNSTTHTPGTRERFTFHHNINFGDQVCFGVAPNDGNGNYTATGLNLTVTTSSD